MSLKTDLKDIKNYYNRGEPYKKAERLFEKVVDTLEYIRNLDKKYLYELEAIELLILSIQKKYKQGTPLSGATMNDFNKIYSMIDEIILDIVS